MTAFSAYGKGKRVFSCGRGAGPAKRKRPSGASASEGLWMEVGGALLSRAPGRSIIAARALNGRVRDGNGCLRPARAANQGFRKRGTATEPARIRAGRPALRARAAANRGAGGRRASRTAYQNPSAERVAALAPGACLPGGLPGAFRGLRLGPRFYGEAWRLDAFSAYPVATWLPGRADRLDNRRTRGRPPPVLSY